MSQYLYVMKVWREIFLEIALRAIRRTHYEFGTWELGQTRLTLKDFSRLNQGNGISFAPEETVRDSISQEIILSGLWKQHPIEGEKRSYWIDREVRIFFKDKTDQYFDIDIIFKRIETKAKDKQPTLPTLIEAKRFELVTIDLKTKKVKVGRPQFDNINKDILKLKLLKDVFKNKKIIIKNKQFKAFRTYILIWGLGHDEFNVKNDFIDKLKDGKYLSKTEMSIKYLPIQWNKQLRVIKYLWIGLFQID